MPAGRDWKKVSISICLYSLSLLGGMIYQRILINMKKPDSCPSPSLVQNDMRGKCPSVLQTKHKQTTGQKAKKAMRLYAHSPITMRNYYLEN